MPLRLLLRTVAHEVHQRLHRHDGFAAVQDATIGRAGYQALLARLFGFYVPFEAAVAPGDDRSRRLRDDLETLGVGCPALAALPVCPYVPCLDSPARRLGAGSSWATVPALEQRGGVLLRSHSLRTDRKPKSRALQ